MLSDMCITVLPQAMERALAKKDEAAKGIRDVCAWRRLSVNIF